MTRNQCRWDTTSSRASASSVAMSAAFSAGGIQSVWRGSSSIAHHHIRHHSKAGIAVTTNIMCQPNALMAKPHKGLPRAMATGVPISTMLARARSSRVNHARISTTKPGSVPPSDRPSRNRLITSSVSLCTRAVVAEITAQPMPSIMRVRLALQTEARRPKGICSVRYPQKNTPVAKPIAVALRPSSARIAGNASAMLARSTCDMTSITSVTP